MLRISLRRPSGISVTGTWDENRREGWEERRLERWGIAGLNSGRNDALSVSVSTALENPAWDTFLRGTPLGEFPQSSLWAAFKQVDGWQCHRTVLQKGRDIAGGFQLLWRSSRWGRIGYVSRGPVPATEDEELVDTLSDLLTRAARTLRLTGMVVQPPGRSRVIASRLSSSRFPANRVLDIVTATLVVDVSGGMEAVETGMRRTTRQLLRKAARNGVSVREGTEADIGIFFWLMLETCKRQKVEPNPSSEKALRELWLASRKAEGCRLTLAEHDGRPVSGLFCIPFGDVVAIWKKGSLPESLHLHPVELLYREAFAWAHSQGYHYCDFTALDRRTADALTAGVPLSGKQKAGRDIFNLGFGGRPVLLPEVCIHFPNPLLSMAYRTFSVLQQAARRIPGLSRIQ